MKDAAGADYHYMTLPELCPTHGSPPVEAGVDQDRFRYVVYSCGCRAAHRAHGPLELQPSLFDPTDPGETIH